MNFFSKFFFSVFNGKPIPRKSIRTTKENEDICSSGDEDKLFEISKKYMHNYQMQLKSDVFSEFSKKIGFLPVHQKYIKINGNIYNIVKTKIEISFTEYDLSNIDKDENRKLIIEH